MRADTMSFIRWTPPDLAEHREWRDVTVVGDSWEVEMDAYGDMAREGTYRHRPMTVNGRSWEWVPGRPPTGFWKTDVWSAVFYPEPDAVWRSQDGDIVIYGRKGSTVGCTDPSCSIWMIPGTGHG